jgi:hypothetical protein
MAEMRVGVMPDYHYAKYWESVGIWCGRDRHEDCMGKRTEIAYLEYVICTCPCHDQEA